MASRMSVAIIPCQLSSLGGAGWPCNGSGCLEMRGQRGLPAFWLGRLGTCGCHLAGGGGGGYHSDRVKCEALAMLRFVLIGTTCDPEG